MTIKNARAKRARKKNRVTFFFYLTLYVTCVVFLHSGSSPLSLNPSISIRVYKTVVIPNTLYGSELWSSMTPASLRKLEHSLKFCLIHMQGLPRRTPTNFTLSAINAVPIETVIDHTNWTFLDTCVPFHARICLNVSSTYTFPTLGQPEPWFHPWY